MIRFSLILVLLCGAASSAFAIDDTHGTAIRPAAPKGTNTKIIPLPIYATLPNEGSTYGFMPVFLTVENDTQRTESIVAPSISWNKIIRFTSTFRWYHYPDKYKTLTLIPSISTNVNRGLTLEYTNLPRETGAKTIDAGFHFRRSIFYRFFGLGPQSQAGNETSYTSLGGDLSARYGYNVSSQFNVGIRAGINRWLVEDQHVDFLPPINEKFPNTPGLGGAFSAFQGLSLRYDTRALREFSPAGFSTELFGGFNEGFTGSPDFGILQAESRALWEETSWVQGAARAFWGYTPGSSDIPFFYQNTLGGSFRMRGFIEQRFIDKGAWTIELEQRIRLMQLHIYGVTSDWRIDPFVAVGQVYSDARDFFRYMKVSGGLGFRAFVRPNVLGRIDTAVGGEGIKVYVELGYPF